MDEEKFLIYQRGDLSFFIISLFVVKKYYFKLVGKDFGKVIAYMKGSHLFLIYDKKWVFRESKRLMKGLINNRKFKKSFILDWMRHIKNCDNYVRQFRKIDLRNISQKELEYQFYKFVKYFVPFMVFTGYTIDFLDEIVFDELKNILAKKIKNNFDEQFGKITTAVKTTYINKCDLSFWKIVKEISSKKDLRRIILREKLASVKKHLNKDSKIFKMMRCHLNDYWWTKLGWSPQPEETEKDLICEIKKALNSGKNMEREIDRLLTYSKLVSQRKKATIKKIGLREKYFLKLLEFFEEMAIYHDQRKEYQMKMIYCAFQVLQGIARKNKKIKFEDLLCYSKNEITEYFKKGDYLDKNELKKRKYALFYCADKNKSLLKFGADAKKEFDKKINYNSKISEIKELHGVVAYRGKIRGIVKVSHSAKEIIKKIKPNDILVSSMTLPDFVPAMKKSAAIITDEGGVTCHAAIISRELKIPCIVGTKIATQVLKDGDLVEVDADKGVVKILK
jgi:phosphohistidine swiveling domain-containing protein